MATVWRRLTALSSLTLQTAGHNAVFLFLLEALRLHPSLVELNLHHGGAQDFPVTMSGNALPHRLTSLHMHVRLRFQ